MIEQALATFGSQLCQWKKNTCHATELPATRNHSFGSMGTPRSTKSFPLPVPDVFPPAITPLQIVPASVTVLCLFLVCF